MTAPRLQSVSITTPSGALHAEFAAPTDSVSDVHAPGVLVIHEAWGLNDDIRRITQRFAEHGYAALAPDLYSVGPPRPFCIVQTMRSLMANDGRAFDSLDAARQWLVDHERVDSSRLAIAGFCMGGGFAILHAVSASYQASAPYYARVPRDARDLEGICPVVGGFGAQDTITPGMAERLRGHLEALDVPHDIVEYPEAGHSYMNDIPGGFPSLLVRLQRRRGSIIGLDPEASEDSWRRMLDFFERHLGGTTEPVET